MRCEAHVRFLGGRRSNALPLPDHKADYATDSHALRTGVASLWFVEIHDLLQPQQTAFQQPGLPNHTQIAFLIILIIRNCTFRG